jgi:hypothetical protein
MGPELSALAAGKNISPHSAQNILFFVFDIR